MSVYVLFLDSSGNPGCSMYTHIQTHVHRHIQAYIKNILTYTDSNIWTQEYECTHTYLCTDTLANTIHYANRQPNTIAHIVYLQIHTHTFKQPYKHTYIQIHTYIHIDIYASIHTNIHTYVYIQIRHIQICIVIHTHMHTSVYIRRDLQSTSCYGYRNVLTDEWTYRM